MKVLKQGAEAIIYSEKIDGEEFLVKERVRKRYRLEQIDGRLRTERTRQEMKLMREARANGVLTPKIVSSDEASCKIVMEKVDGTLMKDFISKSGSPGKVCRLIGSNVGKLHSAGIVHGDLTTSNMILRDKKIVFIDFGLGSFSKRIEDMATDLGVLRESLEATHSKAAKACWRNIAAGYRSENKDSKAVFERMDKQESRARYRDRAQI